MESQYFDYAKARYDSGDFEGAVSAFASVVQDHGSEFGPGDFGYAYHMIGNALVKQKRFGEAVPIYRQALKDTAYAKRAAVNVNLGMALASKKSYQEAIKCYEAALDDASYRTPYKAYNALASAQLKLGDATSAGSNYRKAALDKGNPDPGHALVNLGVCFMALNRPSDAVESYITALDFEQNAQARNKLYANLGQAYVATGRMQEAIEAFENAIKDSRYRLSDSAFMDYNRAKTALANERVVGGELDFADDPYLSSSTADKTAALQSFDSPELYSPSDDYSVIPPADDTGFFSLTDDEIDRLGRNEMIAIKKSRNTGPKIFLIVALVVLAIVLAGCFLCWRGYGYPLQETVVQDMFAAYSNGESVDSYWSSDLSSDDVSKHMASVAQTSDITVDAVQRSFRESTAQVTATLEEGGQVHYNITLARDGIGWKITEISMYFTSQSDG